MNFAGDAYVSCLKSPKRAAFFFPSDSYQAVVHRTSEEIKNKIPQKERSVVTVLKDIIQK